MKLKFRLTKKQLVIAGVGLLVALIAFSRAKKDTGADTGPQLVPVVIEDVTNTVVDRKSVV